MEETYQKGDYTIKILQDNDCRESPREWDNLGTIAYKHRNYCLGEETISDPVDWLCEKIGYSEEYKYRLAEKLECDVYSNKMKDWLQCEFFKRYIALPIYLYDHSGITINTTGFSCPWDSGQVGYIYVTKEKVRKEYSVKRISSKLEAKVEDILRNEIKTFDHYLTGDVWGYEIEDKDGNHKDSCWGFIGDVDYCKSEAESMVEYYIENE